jgi:hypothetical protein
MKVELGKPMCSKPGCRTPARVSGMCDLHWRDFQVDEDRRIAKEKRQKEAWERARN